MAYLHRIFLVRHGETAWSLSGQHTGRTDIPLTAKGEDDARNVNGRMRLTAFNAVFTSPLQRARRTAELAAPATPAEIDPDLIEWDHGEYEGLRTSEIRATRPEWTIFKDGCPGGETPAQISLRADRIIARFHNFEGDIAVFSHGHFGRALAARWIGLEVEQALHFQLDTASLSILGYERQGTSEPAIILWNALPDEKLGP